MNGISILTVMQLINANLLFSLLLLACVGCAKDSPKRQMIDKPEKSDQIKWPSLPRTGFVAGRIANQQDVAAGNAAFASSGGITSEVSKTVVPQYGLWIDDGDNPVPVIVIQAEIIHSEKGDIEAYGLRSIDSGTLIFEVSENVKLLGTTIPDKLKCIEPSIGPKGSIPRP
jgi:hypothetical protein